MNINPRSVTIAGGGIAGIASALALARAGWCPVVYEQADEFTEVGAGVQLGPNVTRILRDWGVLDSLNSYSCQPRYLNARSAYTGEVLARMDLHALGRRYGAPYITVHRAELHRVLLNAALHQGALVQGASTVTALLSQLDHVMAQVSSLHLRDELQTQPPLDVPKRQPKQGAFGQQTIVSTWAVVADGVWSQLRQTLCQDLPPRWTGHLAYRTLMPMSALPAERHAQMRTDEITVWLGANLHLVVYPVSTGQKLNVVCLVEAELPAAAPHAQSWDWRKTESQTRSDLQRALRSTWGDLKEWIQACEGWRLWPLYGRAPIQGPQEQATQRVAILGDAAHPMLPYLAQGAGMAIEDAFVLGQCLPLTPELEIPTALKTFARSRWARNARVQRCAIRNGEIFHAQGPMRLARDWSLRLIGERLMDIPWLYK